MVKIIVSALKFTTSFVIPDNLAGYTESDPEHKIDVHISAYGVFKRMVSDIEKIGILSKVLVESKKRMRAKYHDRLLAEIKKK